MDIIYIHQYFNTPDMPGGTRSFEMGRRMTAAGHKVHMVTTRCDGRARIQKGWYETVEGGMTVHWLVNPYSNHMSYKDRMVAFIRFALQSAVKAGKIQGDVVFATSTPLTVAIPAIYASLKNRIPMVFEIRDLWPEGPIRVGALKNPLSIAAARWLERRAYFGASHVIALSPEMKDGVISTGYPEEKVTVIPNSSDIEIFRVPAEAGRSFLKKNTFLSYGPVVSYIGTLGLINGVGYLVDIARSMLDINPLIRFLIVGDGREKEKVYNRAVEFGVLNRNLWMFTAVPKHDVPSILSATTVATSLVIEKVSNKPQSANKVFDTFAAGKPLLINHGGWFADIIKESGAGLIVPACNATAAAQRLNNFLQDKEKLRKAEIASAQLADNQFSRDRHTGQLMEILESVTGENNKPVKSNCQYIFPN